MENFKVTSEVIDGELYTCIEQDRLGLNFEVDIDMLFSTRKDYINEKTREGFTVAPDALGDNKEYLSKGEIKNLLEGNNIILDNVIDIKKGRSRKYKI